MSPITSQPRVSYRTVRLGGYRTLDLQVIGAMVICLFVIGLAGAVVIGRHKVSKISENIIGRDLGGRALQVTGPSYYPDYYPGGILDMLRKVRTGYKSPLGRDMDGIVP